uniref:GNAT family N-acetyltransferase n=1 Tax=Ignavibacterium album TaxID=591197 RepID=A0A832CWU5_9BACT
MKLIYKILDIDDISGDIYEIIDRFLKNIHDSSIYHHPSWLSAIEKSFNQKGYYLLVRNQKEEITGILPFFTVKSIITGKRIVTLPLSTYCDPLILNGLLQECINFIKKQFPDFNSFDLRTLKNYSNVLNEFSEESEYVTHILNLKESIDDTFNAFHPTSVRASIRRAEKNNLTIKWGETVEELKIFYHLELRLRKRLLIPPLPFKFFFNVWQSLKEFNMIHLPVIIKDNIPIATGFILNFKDTFYLEYTAADKDYFNLYPNHKLFFEVIKKAHQMGAKKIDFGRTSLDNISLITFKEKWAAKKEAIYHYHYPNKPIIKKEQNRLKRVLTNINKHLPDKLFEAEGKILYRHFL